MRNEHYALSQGSISKDYDLNGTGWGPDYQDPATYLNILDAKKPSPLNTWDHHERSRSDGSSWTGSRNFDDAAAEKLATLISVMKNMQSLNWVSDSSL